MDAVTAVSAGCTRAAPVHVGADSSQTNNWIGAREAWRLM